LSLEVMPSSSFRQPPAICGDPSGKHPPGPGQNDWMASQARREGGRGDDQPGFVWHRLEREGRPGEIWTRGGGQMSPKEMPRNDVQGP
jgi:hypothetical protein